MEHSFPQRPPWAWQCLTSLSLTHGSRSILKMWWPLKRPLVVVGMDISAAAGVHVFGGCSGLTPLSPLTPSLAPSSATLGRLLPPHASTTGSSGLAASFRADTPSTSSGWLHLVGESWVRRLVSLSPALGRLGLDFALVGSSGQHASKPLSILMHVLLQRGPVSNLKWIKTVQSRQLL